MILRCRKCGLEIATDGLTWADVAEIQSQPCGSPLGGQHRLLGGSK